MLTRDSIQQYVQLLVERFQPRTVLLFGSQAEGTAGIDSDVDLLVVMNHDMAELMHDSQAQHLAWAVCLRVGMDAARGPSIPGSLS